ncbi:disulfide oxidoreductase [Desulfosporosinus sp. OT]|uniref:disulfide oxidoreductase n=1 Tax=Desulfosporosinus sp. OT TaxID=913865 RepID=UPI000223AAFC|nr:disulfide oxidoreductase [Desulfosporosinus sp. OT]EGW37651.1 disulfide bond formation DsbB family protein [Desulfosporosinus sp. OT]
MIKLNKRVSLYLAWLISIIATCSSLYFSEVFGWEPCKICWYQRIAMYPLVGLLGIAFYRNDRNIAIYAIPLSLSGGAVSLINYLAQKSNKPFLNLFCTDTNCIKEYFNFFGFITLPLLAFLVFISISTLLWFLYYQNDG